MTYKLTEASAMTSIQECFCQDLSIQEGSFKWQCLPKKPLRMPLILQHASGLMLWDQYSWMCVSIAFIFQKASTTGNTDNTDNTEYNDDNTDNKH